MLNGPEPTASPLATSLSAGNTSSSTIEPAEAWVSTYWNVVSGLFRWNTTVCGSGVSTESSEASSTDAPLGSAIFRLRSKLNLTSDEVRSSPLENFRPLRSVHVNVVGSLYLHDWAASPTGLAWPAGTVSSCWYIWYCSVDEPRSYDPAGSS